MCLVEVYAGGSEAVALVDRATDSLEDVARRVLERMGREGMPSEIVRATDRRRAEGGPQAPLPGQARGAGDLAPQLWEWLLLYPLPPGPLGGPPAVLRPLPFEERQAASNPSERLLRALAAVVAEKGYPETTVAEIVERAGMSYRAFYERFENKEDAIVAALDSRLMHKCSRRRCRPSAGPKLGARGTGHAGGDVPLRRAGARVCATRGRSRCMRRVNGRSSSATGHRRHGGVAGDRL